MKYKITTPVPDYSGEIAGIHFAKGVALVEAPAPLGRLDAGDRPLTREQLAERSAIAQDPAYRALAYFRAAGYVVEEATEHPPTVAEDPDEVDPAARVAALEAALAVAKKEKAAADKAAKEAKAAADAAAKTSEEATQ